MPLATVHHSKYSISITVPFPLNTVCLLFPLNTVCLLFQYIQSAFLYIPFHWKLTTVEPLLTSTFTGSQQQPPSYYSQISDSSKCHLTIYLTLLEQWPVLRLPRQGITLVTLALWSHGHSSEHYMSVISIQPPVRPRHSTTIMSMNTGLDTVNMCHSIQLRNHNSMRMSSTKKRA